MHEIIIKALLKSSEIIGELLVDLNGNYIVQKALSLSKGKDFIEILTMVSENLSQLQTVSFGSKLASKLLGMYPEIKSIKRGNWAHPSTRQCDYVQSNRACKYESIQSRK